MIISLGSFLSLFNELGSVSEQNRFVINCRTRVAALPLSLFFRNNCQEDSQLMFRVLNGETIIEIEEDNIMLLSPTIISIRPSQLAIRIPEHANHEHFVDTLCGCA